MYNKAILIGRLVADPEMRTTPNGVNVASLRIAVDRAYTSKGAEKKADFINIVCWRQQAEFVSRYFSKGKAIGIEGSIQTRDYTDKEGNKRYAFEVVADRVFFVESKNASGGTPAAAPAVNEGVSYASGSAGDFQVVDNDDDLPF
ncbi:single-stranded DNA-binding protein [Oscillospiraceae bacterium LTW-04]|nr:single-stranded DNA-binding protein [Oscillospiraceae bacterium MB24-C1]